MLRSDCPFLELDPTHVRCVDITGPRAVWAEAWIVPPGPEHFGERPDVPQEDPYS